MHRLASQQAHSAHLPFEPASHARSQLRVARARAQNIRSFSSRLAWGILDSCTVLWHSSVYPLSSVPCSSKTFNLHGSLTFNVAHRLSSMGYIVVTVDHPYDAGIVTFPDNTTILAANITTDAEIVDDLSIRVRDVSFVLDQLHRPSIISKLIPGQTCGLDTSKVGIYGHSLGGATAAQAMLSDSRLKGGINLDGTFFGSVINRGLDKPFMIMAHEGKNLTTDASWGALWPKLKGIRRRFTLSGSTHGTFTDLAQAADAIGLREEYPAQTAAFLGSIDGGRALQVIAAYTSRFFDFVLKGKNVDFLDMSSLEFPEAVVGKD